MSICLLWGLLNLTTLPVANPDKQVIIIINKPKIIIKKCNCLGLCDSRIEWEECECC